MELSGELILKPGKERSLQRRHPWVYDTAIARVKGRPHAGALVAVRGADGAFLAWAAYSPQSTIRARCWSFVETERIDGAWFGRRVIASVRRRDALVSESDALRLVFGEADGLPGFIADRYAGQLVVQFQAVGVDGHRDVLVDALVDAVGCGNVFERADSATRQREGLAGATGVRRGAAPPDRIAIVENALDFFVDVRRGHKTGFYIDQRANRALARGLARRLSAASDGSAAIARAEHRRLRVLNCFCYTGGFSIALAAGCAAVGLPAEVVSVDSSAEALRLAAENAQLNGQSGHEWHKWHMGDVFETLRGLREAGERFDVIVLDPPKFASSHHHVDRAARAYKDINLNALRLLAPGGWLMTFSCSGAIDVDLFQKIVAGAVFDARIDAQMTTRLSAGEDHPLLMTHPEGEYLKGLLLRRV